MIITHATPNEIKDRSEFTKIFKNSPIPDQEILMNFPLYLPRQFLTHILYMNFLYQKQVGIHGDIMEFGCRYGRNMALFENLRGIYEPYNYTRKIIGFDTFKGFDNINENDCFDERGRSIVNKGDYSTPDGYISHLKSVMAYHKSCNPVSHIQNVEVIVGDVRDTLKAYISEHPETIISMLYFDMDLYQPTHDALELILPCITKGAVIAFDELKFDTFKGETVAFKQVFNINNIKLRRFKYDPIRSYFIFNE